MKIAYLASLLFVALIPALPLKAQATNTTNTAAVTSPAASGSLLISNGQSLAFMGDSITQFGWDYPGGYVRQVIAGFKSVGVTITPIPAGISGQTSRDMLKRIQTTVINRHPTWMTLSCGVNDVWHKVVPLDEYKTNVTAMVDQAQAAGIKVMIFTATPIMEADNDFNKNLAPYNDFLRQFAKDRKLPLVDVNAAFWDAIKNTPHPEGTNLITQDGVHPNPDGNFIFAREILKAFGLTTEQITAYEAQWRASDNAAGIYTGIAMSNGVELTPQQNANIAAEGEKEKAGYLNFEIVLCYRALFKTLQAHEQDPDFSPTLNSNSITPEMNKNIIDLVNALPQAPAPSTPPATPAPANATTAAPAAKPPTIRFQANMFIGRAVGVPFAVYKNVVATAQARKINVQQLAAPLFLQALRDAVKQTGDEGANMNFNGAINGFVPMTYANFVKRLKALPPADTITPVSAPASTTSTSTPPPTAK